MTALSLALAPALAPVRAAAQTVPPIPQAQDATATTPGGDPPARVGVLDSLSGTVSFLPNGATQWTAATTNFPVTTGDAVWVQPQGQAEVQVSANRFEITGGTELQMTRLDAATLLATLPQGEVCMSLHNAPAGSSYAVQTPRGLVQLAGAGHYAMVVGDTEHPTQITVLDGGATVTAPGVSLQVGARQMASISGTDTLQGSILPGSPDACLNGLLARERPVGAASAAPVIVQQMTGGEELAQYGDWQATPEYGTVWYPHVEAGWVPYRHGHWAYVAPWGWTWVDDAPWGFAPFHYGRWVDRGGRWGWTPAYGGEEATAQPVYAPALVTFFGLGGAAVGIGIGASLDHGSIGWVPLGPREPYYPWYHASSAYVRQVNIRNVSNVSEVVNNYTHNTYNTVTVNRFVNNGGATVVPAAALAASRPIATAAQPVTPATFAAARPVEGREVLAPTAATAGVTPAVARAFHLPEAAARPAVATPRPSPLARPASLPASGAPALARQAPGAAVAAPPAAIRPEVAHPEAAHPEVAHPEVARPEATARPEGLRPPEVAHPQVAHPQLAQPEVPHPPVAHSEVAQPAITRPVPPRPEAARPEAVRPEAARPEAVRPEAARPAAVPAEPRPAARPEAPRAAVAEPPPRRPEPEARPAPPREAPRPEPRAQVSHPEPQRPAARPEEGKEKRPE
jgi:hypothetical protein